MSHQHFTSVFTPTATVNSLNITHLMSHDRKLRLQCENPAFLLSLSAQNHTLRPIWIFKMILLSCFVFSLHLMHISNTVAQFVLQQKQRFCTEIIKPIMAWKQPNSSSTIKSLGLWRNLLYEMQKDRNLAPYNTSKCFWELVRNQIAPSITMEPFQIKISSSKTLG